jgi:hypothetical protein
MPPAKRKTPTGVNPKALPMVIFRGGFRDRWVYFEADALAEQRATEGSGRRMVYVPTERFERHPLEPEHSCRVWEFTESVDSEVDKSVDG